MARQQPGGLSAGFSALLAIGLLGAGALLREWGVLLGGAPGLGDGGKAAPSQQHLASLEADLAELREMMNASMRSLRAELHAATSGLAPAAAKAPEAPAAPFALLAPPGQAADRSLVRPPLAFTEANLIAVGQEMVPRLRDCCLKLGVNRRMDSIAWMEAIAIIAAAVVTQVDVLIESGVASGFSSEVWGRFFAGTHVKIYSIDKNSEGQNDNEAAAKRLAPFPNVHFMEGDSMDEVPRLLSKHAGQRIGIFIDGPKTYLGSELALRTTEATSDVKFSAQHDVTDYALIDDHLYKAHGEWERVIVRTFQATWRREFSSLDGCPIDPESKCGWGILLMRGQDDGPVGADDKKFRDAMMASGGR